MTARSVVHDSFTLTRTYPAAPERVFAVWASESAKAVWFAQGDGPQESITAYELDFRVGGREWFEGTTPDGREFFYSAIHQDIVDGERIVASYEVLIDRRRISVSLMTVEITGVADGTEVRVSEQGAYLDGLDDNESRIVGVEGNLDELGKYLAAAG